MSKVPFEDAESPPAPDVELAGAHSPVPRPSGLARRMQALPHAGIWAGVVLAAVGLTLIVIAWGRTAGLTDVALQVPYVISAGFTGLALVVVGVAIVSIAAKQEDSRERARQLAELREILAELRRSVEGDER